MNQQDRLSGRSIYYTCENRAMQKQNKKEKATWEKGERKDIRIEEGRDMIERER